jgi:hypothetical protein
MRGIDRTRCGAHLREDRQDVGRGRDARQCERRQHAEQRKPRGEPHGMKFDSLDRYLLEERPPKAQLVKELLKERADVPGAAAFYQGIQMLGPKTPDLTLIALRLVLAGKTADDASVVRLRQIIERARAKGIDAQSAVEAYYKELE